MANKNVEFELERLYLKMVSRLKDNLEDFVMLYANRNPREVNREQLQALIPLFKQSLDSGFHKFVDTFVKEAKEATNPDK